MGYVADSLDYMVALKELMWRLIIRFTHFLSTRPIRPATPNDSLSGVCPLIPIRAVRIAVFVALLPLPTARTAAGQSDGAAVVLATAAEHVLRKLDGAVPSQERRIVVDPRVLAQESTLMPRVGAVSEQGAGVASMIGAQLIGPDQMMDCDYSCLLEGANILMRFSEPIVHGRGSRVTVQAIYRTARSQIEPREQHFLLIRLRLDQLDDGRWTVVNEEFVAAS